MKPFWFAFNTADWLSSKSVRMMSLAERGAYIGLLATAWGEDRPGTLPPAEDFVRRLAEMSPDEWKVSGPVILALFPLSDCGTYRYNPRLLEEAGKREELSEKKAEAGRRSAAKRAAASTEGQQNANTNPTPVEIPATGVDEKANQLQLQLQLQAKAVEAAAGGEQPSSLPAQKTPKELAALSAGESDQYTADTVPMLNDPRMFAIVIDRLGYSPADLDAEFYRKQIKATAGTAGMEAGVLQFQNFVKKYLNNEKNSRDGLTKPPGVGLLPNQIPSNYPAGVPYVAPPSMGIPDRSSYLKPQPAGQYTGAIK